MRLWVMAGGLDGPRALPQAGGLLDQAAVLMDAWNVVRATVTKALEKTKAE